MFGADPIHSFIRLRSGLAGAGEAPDDDDQTDHDPSENLNLDEADWPAHAPAPARRPAGLAAPPLGGPGKA